MTEYTVEEFQDDFDNLIERVENGETIKITSGNQAAYMIPYTDYQYSVNVEKLTEDYDWAKNHDDAC